MEPQSSNGCASAEARAASIKLVFKKAMLSKLGHSAASTTRPLDDGEAAEPAAATPKTAEKKSEKKASSAAKRPQKAQSAPAKASPSKAAPAKSSSKAAPSKAAPSKAAAAAKKVTPQKQKRSDSNVDAASITTDLGISVISSTEGLDLADAAGDALPMGRVKRTMRELVGDLKLSNESVAAIVVACHGFISYMTTQVALRASAQPSRFTAPYLTRPPPSSRLRWPLQTLSFTTTTSRRWCETAKCSSFWTRLCRSA